MKYSTLRYAFFATALAATSANAAVVLQDSFDYALADDAGLNTTTAAGTWTTPAANYGAIYKFDTTGLTSSQMTGELGGSAWSSGSSGATRAFDSTAIPGSNAASDTTYWGTFLFSYSGGNPATTRDDANTTGLTSNATNNAGERIVLWGANSVSGVGVGFQTVGGQAQLLAIGSTASGRSSGAAINFDNAATNLLVFRVDWNSATSDVMSVWLNPTDVSSISALGTASSTVAGTFANGTTGIYQRNGVTTQNLTFDEFTLATAFSDLPITSVPEPSTFAALAGLGVLGFATSRRRR